MIENKNYEKIVIYNYGKVGSTALTFSNKDRQYYNKINEYYHNYILKTHTHKVLEDIIKKHTNILIIIGIRLPINRNISCFWENIYKENHYPNYKNDTIENIINKYKEKYSVTNCDYWFEKCFDILDIKIDEINFDFNKKICNIKKNNNDILFYRFEDFSYLIKNVFPRYNIFIDRVYYSSSSKDYYDKYLLHKKKYKVDDLEIRKIKDSIYLKKFYTTKEIEDHINDYI